MFVNIRIWFNFGPSRIRFSLGHVFDLGGFFGLEGELDQRIVGL